MKLHWEIEVEDVTRGIAFLNAQKRVEFVENRIQKNVERRDPKFSRDLCWQTIVGCLLTTQQRSGPGSPVTRFMSTNPHPLSYQKCRKTRDLVSLVELSIKRFGGIRRGKIIARELRANLTWLENGGWAEISSIYEMLKHDTSPQLERQAAATIWNNMYGFGPKQSRNLLQDLGLTKYEIPIDSRITKWMNQFGFPVRLSATALSDPSYYDFIEDGFQAFCKAVGTLPCVMDAAIFSSFDRAQPK